MEAAAALVPEVSQSAYITEVSTGERWSLPVSSVQEMCAKFEVTRSPLHQSMEFGHWSFWGPEHFSEMETWQECRLAAMVAILLLAIAGLCIFHHISWTKH